MLLFVVTALAADVDRVPQDFPTLQAAVDEGTAPVIRLGKGRWAGATVDRAVQIVGDEAIIDRGVDAGRLTPALHLVAGADGVTVEGVRVDCDGQVDAGVFSSVRRGGLATDVVVRDSGFRGCVQGVTVAGDGATDALWWIEGNRFHGIGAAPLRGGQGGALGIVAVDVAMVDVVDNRFVGWVDEVEGFTTAETALVGCERCSVVGNRFEAVGGVTHEAVVEDGARVPRQSAP